MPFSGRKSSSPPYIQGKLDLSFDSVRWLYLSAMVIYPAMAFVYPQLLPQTHDPIWLRFAVAGAMSSTYLLALKLDFVHRNITYFTIYLYYVITGHTIYLIHANNMAVEYVTGLIIIVGIGHVIFWNFRQVLIFLLYLTLLCLGVTFLITEPVMNPGTFLISVLVIGLFAFISLVLRLSLTKNLILSSFIIKNMNDGILAVSMKDIITYSNDNIYSVLGFTKEELLGKDVKKFLATTSDMDLVESKTELRQKGVSEVYELNFIHKNGQVVHTQVSASPTYDNRGTASGSVAHISNITARKKVEDELKRQSLIANKTDSYVILTNAEDKIEYVNHSFEKYTGYSLEEVRGKRPTDFLRGSDTSQATIRLIDENVYKESGFSEEIKNYRKDGVPVWLSLNVTPLKNEHGVPTGFITIGNDITTKKQAEEKLRLDSFRLGIIREIDATIIASESLTELAYSTVNYLGRLLPSTCTVHISVRNFETKSYKTITQDNSFSAPKDQLPSDVIQRLSNGIPHIERNIKSTNHSKRVKDLLAENNIESYMLIPFVYNEELMGTLNIYWADEEDQLNEYAELIQGASRDLAISIKQFELQSTITSKNVELQSRLKELESTHNELQDFSYIVSHDLKAPLRAISSLAQWLENDFQDKLGKEGQEYLAMLVNRTNRLHSIIEGILEYSRVGRKNLTKEHLDTMKLIKSAVDMISITSDTRIIIDDTLPQVYYNSTELFQVFQNLIGNAIKFMDKENGEIHIGFQENGNDTEFYVKDNGPGIKSQHHDKVFKIFQTLNARDDFESTGIGLTIVKKIVELNGGKIWIDSDHNPGTCMRFSVLNKITE